MQIFIYQILALSTSISTAAIGYFTSRNSAQKTTKTFAVMSYTISFWSLALFFHSISSIRIQSVYWARLLQIGAIFIPITYLRFVVELTGPNKNKSRLMNLAYFLGLLFSFINILSPAIVLNSSPKGGFLYFMDPGYLYLTHIFLFFSFVGAGLYLLYRKIIRADNIAKNQFLIVFIASVIGFTGGGSNYLPVYNLFVFPLFPYGNVLTIGYIAFIALAITKTRLMDISVVISKSFAYGMTIAVLGAFYLILAFPYIMFVSPRADIGFLSMTIACGIFVGFVFERLRMFFQTSSDKLFLQGKYDFAPTVALILEKLAFVSSLEDLSALLEKVRVDNFESSVLELIACDEKSSDVPLIKMMKAGKSVLFSEDLPKDISSDLIKRKIEFIVPCSLRNELAAVILVGRKLSENSYREEEIDVFRVLAPQIAVVIERIKPYEQVKEEVLTQQAKAKSAEEIADKAMEVAEKMSQQASYATLTRGIAHEIRNPMAIMLSRAEITEKHLDDKEAVAKFADMIKRNILRLINITETMLKYGGAVSNERTKLSVAYLLQDILLLAEGEFKKREITVTTDISNDLSIIGDPNRLNQAFLNIILNAMQAIGTKGTIIVGVKESAFKNKKGETANGIEVSIKDSGCGISSENLPNIFDPFFTTKHECTGLGLSLVARIIDEHGGMIEIDSAVGKGTTFRVYLPLQ